VVAGEFLPVGLAVGFWLCRWLGLPWHGRYGLGGGVGDVAEGGELGEG
jgi:hypothetical protein